MRPSPLVPFLDERARLTSGWTVGDERALALHLDTAIIELAGTVPGGSAVIAVGGYGRQVMALHSDVDLAFLHLDRDRAEIEPRVLRPLWDAGLKVGHMSNTPKGTRAFAGTRIDVISTFLTSRFLTGDEAVYADFHKRFLGLLKKEHAQIVQMLTAEEASRRTAAPYRKMACDLKKDRGGIRTLDLIDWRRRLSELQDCPPNPSTADDRLRANLTMARSAIHQAVGRPHDTYDLELREHAANYLKMSVLDLGNLILSTQRQGEQLVDENWPELRGPKTTSSRRPHLTATDLTDRTMVTPEEFDQMVAAHLPDWTRLRDTPHVAPFHAYSVRDHTLACVDEVTALFDSTEDPMTVEALSQIHDREMIVWAAFAHDLGKGMDGPHARTGTDLVAESALIDFVSDPALLLRLVENHLVLADLATRYDPRDAAVVGWVADRIADKQTLAALYLLTVADSRSTGTDTWNDWRAELVRRAYRTVERELTHRGMPEDAQIAVLADRVSEASEGSLSQEQAKRHLTGFGDIYRLGHSPSEIVTHISIANRPLGIGGVTVQTEGGNPASMVLVTNDRPGLLLSVAGTLALNRVSITDARFATRTDGLVFDTFDIVSHDRQVIGAGDLDELAIEVAEAIRRNTNVGEALRAKQLAYRSVELTGFRSKVSIEPVGVGGGRITLEMADRLGLIYNIGLVFQRYGMPIRRARVDTRAGIAYDTFWVDRLPADHGQLTEDLNSISDN